MRVVDLLERSARLWPDHTAVAEIGGPVLTYAELRARAAGLAAGLERRGVARGDRVALLAPDGVVHAEVQCACAYLGAAAVPVGMRAAAPEVAALVDDADPAVGLAHSSAVDRLAAGMAAGRPVVTVDSPEYERLVRTQPAGGLADRATGADVSLVVYTSGSTGTPKGVCLSQHALSFNAVTIALAQRLVHEDVFLSTTPLSHAATGTRITTMMLDGQTLVVLPRFDAGACVDAIRDWRVTSTVMVPTQLHRVLDLDRDWARDLRTLRLLVYGAAPTGLQVILAARSALPCGLYQGYGLSEACTNLTALLPEDHGPAADDRRLRSCGRPVPGVTVRVADAAGVEVPAREVGQLLVRTDKVMTGYWRKPELTAQVLRDGWLHTGDLATMDGDGYVTIVDRAKDMLISGGINVYPSEIEAALHAHPAVAEAAVVGVADPEWGEVPVAYVVARAGEAALDPERLRLHVRERLAGYKVPRRVEIVDDLPRTESGKISKPRLRERATAARPPDASTCGRG